MTSMPPLEELTGFGTPLYCGVLAALVLARGMDFLSTWMATPNLLLEANPIARRMGWRGGVVLNGLVCVLLAAWPLPAVVVVTTSLLVAARNFKSAWWMRAVGEDRYLCWVGEVIQTGGRRLFVLCVIGETALTATVGGVLVWVTPASQFTAAVGLGILAYALAVGFYSILSLRRVAKPR